MRDACRRVRVVLVERLVFEQCLGERSSRSRFSCRSSTTCSCAPTTTRRTSSSMSFCVSGDNSGPPPKRAAGAVAREQGERPDRGAHAPAADHLPGEPGQLVDVRLGAGADVAEDDLLGARPPSDTLILAWSSGSR